MQNRRYEAIFVTNGHLILQPTLRDWIGKVFIGGVWPFWIWVIWTDRQQESEIV